MKILVCGGRAFNDQTSLFNFLDSFQYVMGMVDVVIHGDAPGADQLAGQWARSHGITELKFPADWNKHGKAAGPIRNSIMLTEKPDFVIAFPGGRGTRNMVGQANLNGVKVIFYDSTGIDGL